MKRILVITAVTAVQVGTAFAEPSLERGIYLVEGPAGCGNCHTPQGPDGPMMDRALSGFLVEENEMFTAIAPNITPAARLSGWSDADLVRAIREGIRPDGSVIGPPMPIGLYRRLSDDDVGSIVMYLRQVPPVENDPGASVYNFPLPPAYGPPIDSVASIPAGVTVEYGEYVAGPVAHCVECHSTFGEMGPMLDTHLGAGGGEFKGPWGVSVAANITPHPTEGIGRYTDAELKTMIREGRRPDGSAMLPPMPYHHFAMMTDDDLSAVILYLRSIPVKP